VKGKSKSPKPKIREDLLIPLQIVIKLLMHQVVKGRQHLIRDNSGEIMFILGIVKSNGSIGVSSGGA